MGLVLPAELELDPNAANGEVLWSSTFVPPVLKVGLCSSSGESTLTFRAAQESGQPEGVYSSGIPGVGARFKAKFRNCPQGYWPVVCITTLKEDPGPIELYIELIKIGPFRPTVVSCCGPPVALLDLPYPEAAYVAFTYAGRVSVIMKRQPTCSFPSNSSIQASLATVSAGSFRGVGSTSPERPFKIDLTCKGGDGVTPMDAYVTLTDATDPGNRSNALTLSPESGAKGVGVEVLSGTTVLGYGADSNELGNPGQWKAGTVSPGTSVFSIPLTARYVQTESVVTPGTANARATFTMSYQ
ncbi:hypothetical protein LMG26857_00344 [Achromobacter anxifer]|nr:hypothetical protein LMG26857_00344 [Achromobacter anxifer]